VTADDIQRQFDAFLDWHRRAGGPHRTAFARWASSKDLAPADRRLLLALLRNRAAA
jgi:hypothetical protein